MKAEFQVGLAALLATACGKSYMQETAGTNLAHCLLTSLEWEGETHRVVAFRGSASLRNWITDFDVLWEDLGYCRIHEGFLRGAGSIIPAVRALVGNEPVIVTGHSYGGALALLCAKMLPRSLVKAVYTFGGPRVGDARYSRIYNWWGATEGLAELGTATWRVVLEQDIVPRVPLALMGFRHVGREVFLPTSGGYRFWTPLWFKLASDVVGTWWDWKHGRIAQLSDHPWSRYADRLTKEATDLL